MHKHYRWAGSNLIIKCHFQPKASQEIVGPHGEKPKIQITAVATKGKANSHPFKFISKEFGVSKMRVSIVAGGQSPHKARCINSPTQFPRAALIEQHPKGV